MARRQDLQHREEGRACGRELGEGWPLISLKWTSVGERTSLGSKQELAFLGTWVIMAQHVATPIPPHGPPTAAEFGDAFWGMDPKKSRGVTSVANLGASSLDFELF